jgi:hypothetical protein
MKSLTGQYLMGLGPRRVANPAAKRRALILGLLGTCVREARVKRFCQAEERNKALWSEVSRAVRSHTAKREAKVKVYRSPLLDGGRASGESQRHRVLVMLLQLGAVPIEDLVVCLWERWGSQFAMKHYHHPDTTVVRVRVASLRTSGLIAPPSGDDMVRLTHSGETMARHYTSLIERQENSTKST